MIIVASLLIASVVGYLYIRMRARARLDEQARQHEAESEAAAAEAAEAAKKALLLAKAEADAESEAAAKADMAAQLVANRAKIDHYKQQSPHQLEIATSGVPATALITAATMTNRTFGRNPLVELALEVRGPDGPYAVQLEFVVPLINIPAFQKGASVDVRIDPEHRENVVFVL